MPVEPNVLQELKTDHLRQGQWVEALFVARATAEGLNVSKPWGAYRYDYIVEHAGHTSRVQVKSCWAVRRNHYVCQYQPSGFGRRAYRRTDFDFVAVFIIPEELWYVIPVAKVAHLTSILVLSPHLARSKYYRYEEAWHLLRAPAPGVAGNQEV